MASAEFVRYHFSFFEDTDWARQGLDVLSLLALGAKERERAEEMLLDYLPDVRGVIGLGVLRSPRAEPVLAGMIETERGSEPRFALVELAKALWQIRPDVRWLDAVTEVLVAAGDPWERLHAAEALCAFRDPAAVPALAKALDDPEALVRHHAARALLAIHGLPRLPSDPRHMVYRVASGDAGRREGGKLDIWAAIAGRQIEIG
jgi:hypothetical protein